MLRYTYIACLVEYYKVTTGLKALKLDSKEQGVVNENDKTRKMRGYINVIFARVFLGCSNGVRDRQGMQ
jgi:hypothetical protein